MHHNKQSQFELFPRESGRSSSKKGGQRFFLTSLTLSLDNLVVLGIIAIMCMVISFSLGVERGAKIVKRKENVPAEPQITAETKEKRDFDLENVHLTKADIIGTVSVQVAEKEDNIWHNPDLKEVKVESENPEKSYTVQVASFRKEEYAQKEAMDLKEKGYEIFVIPKGEWSIVCVGKFAEKTEAKRFSRRLRTKYKDCYIRSM